MHDTPCAIDHEEHEPWPGQSAPTTGRRVSKVNLSPPRVALLLVGLLAAGPLLAAGFKVTVSGLGGEERANVEARLDILKYAESGADDETQFRRLHRLAPDDIRAALQAFGYYHPGVRSALQGKGNSLHARYTVERGPPTLLGDVRIELAGDGAEFPELYQRVASQPMRKGARLRHADYENFKTDLLRTAFQRGYLDAAYTAHQLRVDKSQRRADIELVLDTGPRYFFGTVEVEQEKLDEEFLRRYISIRVGDPFSPQKLLDVQFALSDLGYFAQVDIRPQRESLEPGNRIPVKIVLTTRPRGRYELGAGYGTDTGPRATLGTEFRRLTSTGHKLRTDLRVSEVKQSLGAEYRIPLGTVANENLGFTGGYTDEKFDSSSSFRYDIGTYLARTPGAWQRRVYLNYRLERSYLGTGTNTSYQLTPGLSFSRGESDDPIHARLGWYFFFDVHGAHNAVLSDNSFLQVRSQIRAVLPLGTRGRLLFRTEQGASYVDEFSALPLSERFFAGGDQSVRGYSYRSLGPRDVDGRVVGGKYLSTYSLEAEMALAGHWGAAVFADAGNADDKPAPHLFTGIGTGIRYRAPVGTLQLDFAHPLEGDRRGVRLHLGIRVGL